MPRHFVIDPDVCPPRLGDRLPVDRLAALADQIRAARRDDLADFYAGDSLDDWPQLDDDAADPPYTSDLSPAERRLVEDFTSDTGAELLGKGVARAVFRFPDLPEYVVKVGRWGPDVHRCDGREQNRFEALMYDTHAIAADRDAGDLLLPIVAAHPDWSWIVQPYAVTLDAAFGEVEEVYDDDHPVRSVLWDAAEPLREYASTEGCLPHNIGRWRGEWFILDYARPRYDDAVEQLADLPTTIDE